MAGEATDVTGEVAEVTEVAGKVAFPFLPDGSKCIPHQVQSQLRKMSFPDKEGPVLGQGQIRAVFPARTSKQTLLNSKSFFKNRI